MKNKLIVLTIIGLLIAIPSIGMAFKSDKLQSNNNQMEEKPMDDALTAEPTTNEPVPVHKDGVQVDPKQMELPLSTGEPLATPEPTTAPEVKLPDLTPQEYAKQEVEVYAKQGFSGMMYNCFDTLMEKQYKWDVSHSQIDEALTKIRTHYSGTCAALANYHETGSY